MSARSGLAGKRLRGAHLGPSQAIFSMDRKNNKNVKKQCFPWWANGPYSPGLGSCAGVIYSLSVTVPQTKLAMRGSNGLGKGALKGLGGTRR